MLGEQGGGVVSGGTPEQYTEALRDAAAAVLRAQWDLVRTEEAPPRPTADQWHEAVKLAGLVEVALACFRLGEQGEAP